MTAPPDLRPPSFRQCVETCWHNQTFMHEYRRLSGHALGLDKRTPLDRMIDQASGYVPPPLDDAEMHAFFEFVRDYIWMPVVADCLKEAST